MTESTNIVQIPVSVFYTGMSKCHLLFIAVVQHTDGFVVVEDLYSMAS